MKRVAYLVPITCLMAIAVAGLLHGQSPLQTVVPANPGVARGALIGSNDTVTITALNAEEISKAWRVNSSGDLSLPRVGRIHAEGMTLEQLEQEITNRLKKWIKDPQVTAYISETLSHPVTISGDVTRPGVIQLTAPTTLLAALVEAGGLKESATTVKVTRLIENGAMNSPLAHVSEEGKYQVLVAPVKSVMAGDGEGGRFMVLPGDVIIVSSEKRTRMVYITGEVAKPGAIELVTADTVSLTKVVALAGGFTRTAKPSNAIIKHINENNIDTALASINVQKIVDGKAQDLQLSDGDIVVIPSNQLLNYLQLASQSAISTGFLVLARF